MSKYLEIIPINWAFQKFDLTFLETIRFMMDVITNFFRKLFFKRPEVSQPEEKDQAYLKRIEKELDTYKEKLNVHDLPKIYFYWLNKYIKPMFWDAGFDVVKEFFAINLVEAAQRTGSSTPHFVSIGSGNCDLEISIAQLILEKGYENFTLECVELNPAMLERGKLLADEKGLSEFIKFTQDDFNTWIAGQVYDGAMANHSLHHVVDLEHLFAQVKKGLHVRGSFVINDMIGRNGHQRWPEALEKVHLFWQELPEKYRFNLLLNRYEEAYENWDCSHEGFEGIRAQDILPLLLDSFQCEQFISFGNVVDIFVDRCFGHHFNPDSEWDRAFIDRLHEVDESGFERGELTPTHMLAVFVKELSCEPHYARGLKPIAAVRLEEVPSNSA
ncbi:MAG: class I SAM-dependent methyltransferase [Leptolyngbya sp. SIO1D8]|nr:class I SAM-dependent methyltransferase [Leptolyngbya sp. SIO1D8]